MPPLGIDRFNFVCGDPGREFASGFVEAKDALGKAPTWDHAPVSQVPPGDVGFFDGQAFPARSVHVQLSVGPPGGGPYVDIVFDYVVPPRLVGFWIGYVTVGIYATPLGPDDYEPFGVIEIVNGDDAHRQVLLVF